MKIEVITVPVSDVDRAKSFYQGLGWRLDADIALGGQVRVVQLTPPHSNCSISLGRGLAPAFGVDEMAPGSQQRLELVVSDIEAAREELISRGARRQRGLPPRWRTRAGPRPQSHLVHELRHLPRPRRQQLAAAGGHDPTPGPPLGRLMLHRQRHRADLTRVGHPRGPARGRVIRGRHDVRTVVGMVR